MIYALVRNGKIEYVGALPATWNDGTREWNLLDPSVDKLALGWHAVSVVPPPADTPTSTWRSTILLVAGVPVQTWYEYPWSPTELAEAQARQNEIQLRTNPASQITALLASIAALNTLVGRTNADINANPAAAIKEVARETLTIARRTVRLARLQLGVLDSTAVGE